MNDTGYLHPEEREVNGMAKHQIKVDITTVPECNDALLLECSVCGPVCVDSTGISNLVLGHRHLQEVHDIHGVPA